MKMLINLCSQGPIVIVESSDWISNTIALLTFLTTFLTLIVTSYATYYAIKEYKSHQKQSKASVLSKYNERYSNDKNIEKVVQYLILKDKCGFIPPERVPDTCEKEMFLRFFEELQYAIDAEYIDKNTAYDMFAYYALKAYELQENFVSDIKKTEWTRFRRFIYFMKQIQNEKKI